MSSQREMRCLGSDITEVGVRFNSDGGRQITVSLSAEASKPPCSGYGPTTFEAALMQATALLDLRNPTMLTPGKDRPVNVGNDNPLCDNKSRDGGESASQIACDLW